MPKDTSQIVRFPGFSKAGGALLKAYEKDLGKKFTFSNGEWSLNFDDNVNDNGGLKIEHPREPVALKGNADSVADKLCELLEVRHPDRREPIRKFRRGIPSIREQLLLYYNIEPDMADRRFGAVLDIYDAKKRLNAAAAAGVGQVFKENIVPLMTEIFGAEFAIPVKFNDTYLWAINYLARRYFDMEKEGLSAPNYMSTEFISGTGYSFFDMITALTKIDSMHIAYPITRDENAWYFFKEGDCREPNYVLGERSCMQGFADNPRMSNASFEEWRSGRTFFEASMRREFAKQCVFGSIFSVNKLLGYFSDLRNFTTTKQKFDSGKFLKTNSAVRLMQADFMGISLSNDLHTQLALALAFLDKLTNLVIGISGKRGIAEEIVFGNWVREDRPKIVQSILEKRLSRMHREFGNALTQSMHQCYEDIRQSLGAENSKRDNHSGVEARFRELRNVSHGTFLRKSTFEKLHFENSAGFPGEVVMLPYYLLLGFMNSPKEFAEKMVA